MNVELVTFGSRRIPVAVFNNAVKIAESCISSLDEAGLKELSGGSEKDINDLLRDMICEAVDVLTGVRESTRQSRAVILGNIDATLEETFRVHSLNYFIASVLSKELEVNWHHLQWGELASTGRNIAILAARDHGKSFFFSLAYAIWKMYQYNKNDVEQRKNNKNRGFIFSHTDSKAISFLSEIKSTILDNDILRERLYVGSVKGWADSKIITKNDVEVRVKGFMTAARGYHPAWIVCDDVLTDNVIYSPTQREKSIHIFKSVVLQMIVPGGQVVVVGTPFHQNDLYSIFRTKEFREWLYREYPAIFPNGNVLWEDRYSYETLRERRFQLGNVIFSREFLCRPVSSESSLFPYDILRMAISGMDKYKLVQNREAFPIKFEQIVSGHDFAKSANVGADYTVFTVWGIDRDENRWLLYMWRKVGATFQEQIGQLQTVYQNFNPDVMLLENNNFQQIYSEYLAGTGMPIKPHTTGGNKHDLKNGVPSLAIQFERGKFRLPYGDAHSKNCADIMLAEFNNITFTDKGIQSVAGHDDIVMSTWFGHLASTLIKQGSFSYEFL